jgi:hypothetical protein
VKRLTLANETSEQALLPSPPNIPRFEARRLRIAIATAQKREGAELAENRIRRLRLRAAAAVRARRV